MHGEQRTKESNVQWKMHGGQYAIDDPRRKKSSIAVGNAQRGEIVDGSVIPRSVWALTTCYHIRGNSSLTTLSSLPLPIYTTYM